MGTALADAHTSSVRPRRNLSTCFIPPGCYGCLHRGCIIRDSLIESTGMPEGVDAFLRQGSRQDVRRQGLQSLHEFELGCECQPRSR